MDHYERLGLTREAKPEEIRTAFRTLARQYHPDRPDGDTATFKAINEAHQVLSDPQKRAAYDRTGQTAGVATPAGADDLRGWMDEFIHRHFESTRVPAVEQALTDALKRAAHAKNGAAWADGVVVEARRAVEGSICANILIRFPREGLGMAKHLHRELQISRLTDGRLKPSSSLFTEGDGPVKLTAGIWGKGSTLADLTALLDRRFFRGMRVEGVGSVEPDKGHSVV